MKFTLHRARKDCLIPTAALGVAGLKREKELRLEVDNGVIVVLRPGLNAKKLLAVSAFLRGLSDSMIAAVAAESGECSCCGDCQDDDGECAVCESRDKCRGITIPDCLLERAGIGAEQPWKAEIEDGAVTIRAMPEAEAAHDSRFPDYIPEAARTAFVEADICGPPSARNAVRQRPHPILKGVKYAMIKRLFPMLLAVLVLSATAFAADLPEGVSVTDITEQQSDADYTPPEHFPADIQTKTEDGVRLLLKTFEVGSEVSPADLVEPNLAQNGVEYVRRNLDTIMKQAGQGARLHDLPLDLYTKLQTICDLYHQQKTMYDNKTHTVENRIVSIAQPYLRPIVRGKARTPVEFGAKVATAHIGGFAFIIHMSYDNFSEGQYLEKTVGEYKRIFGFYPAVVIGDKAYPTNKNRAFCKDRGIRLSAVKRGKKSEEEKAAEKKLLYQDRCKRNAVEGDYGTVKRKYSLGLIMTKLFDTTMTAISMKFFVANMERFLRLFLVRPFSALPFPSLSFCTPFAA